MSNRLANETSPYLLQHKDNPVDWYPWCHEAFERAAREDKPVFLSIGYSACHWCHVLAHESFEDSEIAELLNKYFVSIKVDKEERPDIDSVYMAVCQSFTGSGGWPMSIFMTADKKPFFAGTYFPRTSRGSMIGLRELLLTIHEKWESDRDLLLQQADAIITHLNRVPDLSEAEDANLPDLAVWQYQRTYDERYGGFGRAPKFPAPHNLLFLMDYYQHHKEASCLDMAEHTLLQMYRGGIFDHIGFGFCRYSTDRKFLVPHFEKMLYDNALLILAYCKAYAITNKAIYLEIAEKSANYILREMTSPEGGFFSSQDADTEGQEGKFYLLTPQEVVAVLGEDVGNRFNSHYDITEAGNFEGQSIPNLLKSDPSDKTFEQFLPALDNYRKERHSLHRDEKILTSWNGLMIAAMCELYLVSKKVEYLYAAQNADAFVQRQLCHDNTLYVSFHKERRGVMGFLDDYAAYIFASLCLYRATLKDEYLERSRQLCHQVAEKFGDHSGGFYLYGNDQEELLLRPKETYDGAIPSGNSLMAHNLVRLSLLTGDEWFANQAERQLAFVEKSASLYPSNHAMFLLALMDNSTPPTKVIVVTDGRDASNTLPLDLPPEALVVSLPHPTEEYPVRNGKTTYYVCMGRHCLPPTNDICDLFGDGACKTS